VGKKAHVMSFFNDELAKQAGIGKSIKGFWQTASGVKAGATQVKLDRALAAHEKLQLLHHAHRKNMILLSKQKPKSHKLLADAARNELSVYRKVLNSQGRIDSAQKAHEAVLGEQKGARIKILGGTAALGTGALVARHMLKKKQALDQGIEPEKQAAEKEKGKGRIDWGRLALISAITGLGVGTLKGVAEGTIAARATKLLKKLRPKMKAEARKNLGWGAARGITSAGSGAAFGVSTAIGLKKRHD